MAITGIGRLRPKKVPFSGLQVYERVGISLVEVFEREEKSVISVCKKTQTDALQKGCKVLN